MNLIQVFTNICLIFYCTFSLAMINDQAQIILKDALERFNKSCDNVYDKKRAQAVSPENRKKALEAIENTFLNGYHAVEKALVPSLDKKIPIVLTSFDSSISFRYLAQTVGGLWHKEAEMEMCQILLGIVKSHNKKAHGDYNDVFKQKKQERFRNSDVIVFVPDSEHMVHNVNKYYTEIINKLLEFQKPIIIAIAKDTLDTQKHTPQQDNIDFQLMPYKDYIAEKSEKPIEPPSIKNNFYQSSKTFIGIGAIMTLIAAILYWKQRSFLFV